MAEEKIYYAESKEKASEYLRLSLSLMAQYSTAPTPTNYSVWYEYVSGKNSNLKKAVDSCIKNSEPFTPQLLEQLFSEHIARGDQLATREALAALQSVVDKVTLNLQETGGSVSKHEEALKKSAALLNNNLNADTVRQITSSILSEADGIIDSGKDLKTKLFEANSQINTLKSELAVSKTEAHTDPLTNLTNRRGMDTLLKREMQQSTKSGTNLCLMMGDIDHFKKINDTYGHLVGDSVIKMFASTLTDFVKGRDEVIRYGGEEFLVVLPDTNTKGAVALAEKIRAFLESMQWKKKGSGELMGKITISLGIAQYRNNEPMESFIKRADSALYFSKENGRNKVSVKE